MNSKLGGIELGKLIRSGKPWGQAFYNMQIKKMYCTRPNYCIVFAIDMTFKNLLGLKRGRK
jgi:hypothetical protein